MPKPEVPTRMENLKAFVDSHSLHAFEGQINSQPGADIGILPRDWEDRYRADANRADGRIVYTVMSYETPIAWVVLGEHGIPLDVVIPKVFYSKMTSKAQACCRKYLPYLDQLVTELS